MEPWRSFTMDMDADGQFTVGDVGLWLYHGFFLPGDCLLWLLLERAPAVARFLELEPTAYGGAVSAFVSALSWLLAMVVVGTTCSFVRGVDLVLTSYTRRLFEETRRRARAARTRLIASWRRRRAGRSSSHAMEPPREIVLDALEIRVLRCHLAVTPGGVLGEREVAVMLGVAREEARRVLDRLHCLRLVTRSLGTVDGDGGYTLTRLGQALLARAD